jgi:hypothetical protein
MTKFQVSFSKFHIIVQNHLCEANDSSITYYAGSDGQLAYGASSPEYGDSQPAH